MKNSKKNEDVFIIKRGDSIFSKQSIPTMLQENEQEQKELEKIIGEIFGSKKRLDGWKFLAENIDEVNEKELMKSLDSFGEEKKEKLVRFATIKKYRNFIGALKYYTPMSFKDFFDMMERNERAYADIFNKYLLLKDIEGKKAKSLRKNIFRLQKIPINKKVKESGSMNKQKLLKKIIPLMTVSKMLRLLRQKGYLKKHIDDGTFKELMMMDWDYK